MKGSAYAWVVILVIIFISSFLWIIFSQMMVPNLIPDTKAMLNETEYEESYEVLEGIESVWNYWPLILIFGLIIYGVVASLKKEPDTYYGWG